MSTKTIFTCDFCGKTSADNTDSLKTEFFYSVVHPSWSTQEKHMCLTCLLMRRDSLMSKSFVERAKDGFVARNSILLGETRYDEGFPYMRFIYDTETGGLIPVTDEGKVLGLEDCVELFTLILKYIKQTNPWKNITNLLRLSSADKTKDVSGVVYLLKGVGGKYDGFYKIGFSTNLENRIPQVSSIYKTKVELLYSIKTDCCRALEKHIHDLHKRKQIEGEWFQLDAADIDEFASMAAHSQKAA